MNFWDQQRQYIAHLTATEPIETCLDWLPIRHTMNCGNAEWLAHELKAIQRNLRWRSIFESYVEHEWAARLEKYPSTHLLGNSIHHIFHWLMFEEYTGKILADIHSIFEFGGGFGSMSRIARFAGFTGEYRILDFPELHVLAKAYCDDDKIVRLNNISELGDSQYDLLVGCWSVTESNAILRNKVMMSNFTNCIIAYSDSFEGLQNAGYFDNVKQRFGGTLIPIPWLVGNSYYVR